MGYVAQALAYTLTFASMWLMARNPKWGLIVAALDTIPWVVVGWTSQTYSLIVFDLVLLGVQVRAIRHHWVVPKV